MSTERLVVKVPEPTGTSIAPWDADFLEFVSPEIKKDKFARYWTRSGRSEELRKATRAARTEQFLADARDWTRSDCQDEQT